MTGREEMEAVVEAILFATPEPVPTDRLLEVFPEQEREQAGAALDAVLDRYRPGPDKPPRGVMVDEVAGGWRLVTRPELHGYLRKFFEISGSNRLSMAAIETLAIVAYRQPITAPEIQELRGVNSSAVLKTLLEHDLIRVAGRKRVVGKPFLYRTTNEFLEHFGLASVDDLPPLEEFEEGLASLEAQQIVADLNRGEGLSEDPQEELDLADVDLDEMDEDEGGEEE